MAAQQQQQQQQQQELSLALAESGLDICVPFAAQWYNDYIIEEGVQDKLSPLETFGRVATQAYLVGNTKALWKPLCAWYRQQPNPVDAYCAQAVERAMDVVFPPGTRRAHHWGCDPDPKSLVSMQRVAEVAGFCHHDKQTTHLSIHSTYGTWLSFRAVVVVDASFGELSSAAAPPPPPPRAPCPLTDGDRAQAAVLLQRALAAGASDYSQEAWQLWLAVRDSISIGKDQHRFSDQQILYHYTGDLRCLSQAVSE